MGIAVDGIIGPDPIVVVIVGGQITVGVGGNSIPDSSYLRICPLLAQFSFDLETTLADGVIIGPFQLNTGA